MQHVNFGTNFSICVAHCIEEAEGDDEEDDEGVQDGVDEEDEEGIHYNGTLLITNLPLLSPSLKIMSLMTKKTTKSKEIR